MEPTNQKEPEPSVETTEQQMPYPVQEKNQSEEPALPVVVSKQDGFFDRFGRKKLAVLATVLIVLVICGGLTFAMLGTRYDTATTTEGTAITTSKDSSSQSDDSSKTNTEQSDTTSDVTTSQTTSPTSTTSGSAGTTNTGTGSTSSPSASTAPTTTPSTLTVSYTNSCYSPANQTIKRGDTVVFVNNSSRDMWPASDNHPIHTNYSEFDARTNISPGASYSFTFTKSGSWGYHDHLKPSCTGTITVQ